MGPDAFMKGVQEVTSNLRTLQMTGTKLMRDIKDKFDIKGNNVFYIKIARLSNDCLGLLFKKSKNILFILSWV